MVRSEQRDGRRGIRCLVGLWLALPGVFLLGGVVATDAVATSSDLVQKPGAPACVSAVGFCSPGTALSGALSVTVSPDGKSVYVASLLSDAVAVLDRGADGTLTQKPGTAGCISETGTAGLCVAGRALDGAASVTVSPDGKSAYVASAPGGLAVLDRAGDGTLTQKPGTAGCISDDGNGGVCVGGAGLSGAVSGVTVSPDGRSAYVASAPGGLAVLDRAPDGTLTQKPGTAGCISDTGAGPCADGTALNGARSVTVSPDGRSAYVAAFDSDAVAVLDRAADGTLTQKPGTAGCISDTGAGPCADGTALNGAFSVTVSPDGRSAYVASSLSDAVAVLDRAADGTLTQRPLTAGCISDTGSGGACVDGSALDAAFSVTVSPDGRSAYAASGLSGAVAVFDRDPEPESVTPGGSTGASGSAGATCRGERATLVATTPLKRGTPRRDVIVGRPGPDLIRGLGGADLVCGRGGNDTLIGGPGADRLLGEDGADRLSGGVGRDLLVGGPGPDRLLGGPAIDLLRGGPGRDLLSGGPGRDRLFGGPGLDRQTQ
jgi:DNA-binding beta-propeller fold protein YncE